MPGLNFKGTNKYQKIAETMLKKTHFTESEIDRLSDLHNDIIVCKYRYYRYLGDGWCNIYNCRKATTTAARLTGRGSGSSCTRTWR